MGRTHPDAVLAPLTAQLGSSLRRAPFERRRVRVARVNQGALDRRAWCYPLGWVVRCQCERRNGFRGGEVGVAVGRVGIAVATGSDEAVGVDEDEGRDMELRVGPI